MRSIQSFLYIFALLCFLIAAATTPRPDLPTRWVRVGLAVLTLALGWAVIQ